MAQHLKQADMEQEDFMTLSDVKAGQKVRLTKVDAGLSMNARLASMGLVPNVEVAMISNGHPGPIVVNVKGTKMMLGRGMAHKIIVSKQ